MKKATIGITAVAMGALLFGFAAPAQAATKAGDTCKKTGQSKSVKGDKGKLVCLKVAGSRQWVFVPSAPGKEKANKAVKSWKNTKELPNEAIIRHFAANSDAYVQERLTLAQQGRDQLAQQSASLTGQQASLAAEAASLPGQVSQAQSAYQQAQSATEEPKKAYLAAKTEWQIVSSELTSAQNARDWNIACTISEMFGYVGAGTCGPSNESYYFSVKAREQAAYAKVSALAQVLDAKNADARNKYDEYKRLYDRQASVQSDINSVNAEIAASSQALVAAEAHLRASHDANGQLQQLKAALNRLDAANNQLERMASKKLPKKWDAQYERMARLSGISQLHRADVIDAFSSFRALTNDLPDPVVQATEPPETESVQPS